MHCVLVNRDDYDSKENMCIIFLKRHAKIPANKPHHLCLLSLAVPPPNSRQVTMETVSVATEMGRNAGFHPHTHNLLSPKKKGGMTQNDRPCY